MIKQDWLDYFEAVNGRSATETEIAQALAAGEFQEEQAAQEASQFVGAPVSPEQANAGFVAAPEAPAPEVPQFAAAPEAPVQEAPQFAAAPEAPAPEVPQFATAPEAPLQEAPQFNAAPEAPVQEAPQFSAAPEAPVQEAPQFAAAPEAPVQEAPQFAAAPEAPVQEAPQYTAAPEAPAFGAQPNGFQQAPQQQPQPGFGQPAPGQAPGQGFQQAPYPGQPQPGQAYYAQPSQFGIAVGGYWNWFLSALKRPSAEYNTKALNGILQYVLTAFVLTLATFFTAIGFTGGYGMDFRAFMLTLISMFFTIYAFQVTGFFVRRVVLQDKEYSYGRSFEEFGRLSVYNLPLALLAFLTGLIKVYEFYGLVNYLIFLLFFVGTCYVVHIGLNKSSLKADRFLLLVASSIIVFLIAIFVLYVNARILEQVAAGFIPNTPSFSNFRF
ncbi:hypothetical protein QP844_05555 [Streptococcus xiaochunlingii]|uniref:DUF6574 domain-containing protein n=1 Tax=Streptococcus xiaochunlingii TaxID=2589788 RepID=UPI002555748D|nr:DUF6574 domain-containing protein [Streptococcus xiaochunlingii]MDK8385910.1 hypothetical protein [Streptococcus xiaochunlingii]MDK8778338.1 hypothetical protein [Streptococcus xiaochunlingii]